MCIYLKDDVLSLETQLISTAVESQITSTEVGQIPSYVYRLVYKPTGQYYYGYRRGNISFNRMPIDDFWIYYFSSSRRVKAMFKKHGLADFDHEIIFESTDVDSVYWLEQHLIKGSINNPLILNKRYVKDGQLMFVSTSESAKKASQTRLNKSKLKKIRVTKTWHLISPTGETYETRNLAQFSREHNLSDMALNLVAKGEAKQHKGWTCTSTLPADSSSTKKRKVKDRSKVEYKNDMPWELINPEGQVVQVKNLRRFCKDNDLNYSSMRDVSYGRQQMHRGWKCVCLSKTHAKLKMQWEAIDPDGNVHRPDNFRLFCQANGLHYNGMREVAAGRQKTTCDGWKCSKYAVEKEPLHWEVINLQGETIIVDDMKQFCKDNGLSYRGMCHVANGTHKEHRGGWKCKRLD
jgi:hypothetical protein